MAIPPQQPTGKAMIRVVATHGIGIHPGTTPLLIILGTTTDGMIPGITPLGAGAGTILGTTTTHGVGDGIVLTTIATMVDTMVAATMATTHATTAMAILVPSLATAATGAALPADACQTIPAQADSMVLATAPTELLPQDALPLVVLPTALYRAVLHVPHQHITILPAHLAAQRPIVVPSTTPCVHRAHLPAVPMAAAALLVALMAAAVLVAAMAVAAVLVPVVAAVAVVPVADADKDISIKCL